MESHQITLTDEQRAELELRLQALNESIASGALEIEYAENRVRFRSVGEQIRARDATLQFLYGPISSASRLSQITDAGGA